MTKIVIPAESSAILGIIPSGAQLVVFRTHLAAILGVTLPGFLALYRNIPDSASALPRRVCQPVAAI